MTCMKPDPKDGKILLRMSESELSPFARFCKRTGRTAQEVLRQYIRSLMSLDESARKARLTRLFDEVAPDELDETIGGFEDSERSHEDEGQKKRRGVG